MRFTASLPGFLVNIDEMSKYLVVYATNSGSTADVANEVASELIKAGNSAEVRKVGDPGDLRAYDAIVVGAPMIFGWHSDALRFVRKHRTDLAGKKVAYFACAMRLTVPDGKIPVAPPITLDPALAETPARAGSLTLKERFTALGYYLQPMLKSTQDIHPVSVAFFKGKLEMFRLKWWQALFVMAVVQAPAGDYRDWELIRSWARSLSSL